MHTKQTNGRGQSQKTHIKQENNEFNLRERERERERRLYTSKVSNRANVTEKGKYIYIHNE